MKNEIFALIIGLAMFILELIKYIESLIKRWKRKHKKKAEENEEG